MLSIIVASHNDSGYINVTLDSIVNRQQTIDLECVVVDKGSTDDTQQICREYCSNFPFIKLVTIPFDDNVLATAYNHGLDIIKGDKVLFLEAGYIPNLDFLQEALEWLDESPNDHAVVISRFYKEYNNDETYQKVEQYWDPDSIVGPELSGCVFSTKHIGNARFDNIPASSEVFAMGVILYNFNFLAHYIYTIDDNPMDGFIRIREPHDREFNVKSSRKYQDMAFIQVQYLQYLPPTFGYSHCLDNNGICINRKDRPIWNMDYHVIDRCNLNCKYCNHLCPIVPSNVPPKTLYEVYSDLEKIAKFRDMISNFTILGGEPLLHPDLGLILKKARELMPNNTIGLTTNGTLYKRLEELAPIIKENNIYITLSLYPVSNTNEIEDAFNKYISPYKMQIARIPTNEGFAKRLLQEDIQTDDALIYACPRRRACTQLANGRIYICHYGAALHYLKEKFGNDVKITDEDAFIELTDKTTSGDIINFLYNSMPDVCRHCWDVTMYDRFKNEYYYDYEPWTISTRELEEFYKHN